MFTTYITDIVTTSCYSANGQLDWDWSSDMFIAYIFSVPITIYYLVVYLLVGISQFLLFLSHYLLLKILFVLPYLLINHHTRVILFFNCR